jgi:thiol-disulfide isomerase/thioredoxin
MASKLKAGIYGLLLFLVSAGMDLPAAVADEAETLAVGAMANFTVLKTPKPAPSVRFIDADGRELKLEDFRGKVVLLDFWATWCAPCRREMPEFDKLQAEFGGDSFQVIALASERKGLPAVRKFYDELEIKHLAIYVDKTMKAQRAFLAYGLPTTVLIDPSGNELGRMVGPAEWHGDDGRKLISHYISRFAKTR